MKWLVTLVAGKAGGKALALFVALLLLGAVAAAPETVREFCGSWLNSPSLSLSAPGMSSP